MRVHISHERFFICFICTIVIAPAAKIPNVSWRKGLTHWRLFFLAILFLPKTFMAFHVVNAWNERGTADAPEQINVVTCNLLEFDLNLNTLRNEPTPGKVRKIHRLLEDRSVLATGFLLYYVSVS